MMDEALEWAFQGCLDVDVCMYFMTEMVQSIFITGGRHGPIPELLLHFLESKQTTPRNSRLIQAVLAPPPNDMHLD
jgi:hypothetical protein